MTETNQNERKMKEMKRTWKTSAENKEHILQSIPNTKRNKDKLTTHPWDVMWVTEVETLTEFEQSEKSIQRANVLHMHGFRERTLRVSETSGAGISRTQAFGDIHASTGRHLHRGIDLRSYDSESTRGPANSGAGVPGVAGADNCGVSAPVAASITAPQLSTQLSVFFSWFFGECGGMEIGGVVLCSLITWFDGFCGGNATAMEGLALGSQDREWRLLLAIHDWIFCQLFFFVFFRLGGKQRLWTNLHDLEAFLDFVLRTQWG